MSITIHHGDCREVMAGMAAGSVHAVVTDPPYELGFMGKSWDRSGIANDVRVWREALRLLPPGGHLLAFGGTRTYHRMVCAIEDAGFTIVDQLGWIYGTGFPKNKALDFCDVQRRQDWSTWGTALKPAWEPIVLARRPLEGTYVENLLEHGVGAVNIDGCRIPTAAGDDIFAKNPHTVNTGSNRIYNAFAPGDPLKPFDPSRGRWPANIVHDGSEEVLEAFPQTTSAGHAPRKRGKGGISTAGHAGQAELPERKFGTGSAARFFYGAKASARDRHEGLTDPGPQFGQWRMPHDAEKVNAQGKGNHHPTVKPTDLMRWLCRLITPPGGIVLDPFAGSGSTLKAAELEGFGGIGIELDADYAAIARRRVGADAPLLREAAA